jgi:hypothetical protein
MSVEPDQEHTVTPSCWCCSTQYPQAELVRLGQHPEVGVCLGCARWLQRRAVQRHDEHHPSPAARMRTGIQRIRTTVIRRGWHERGILGNLLRWIDRHLP